MEKLVQAIADGVPARSIKDRILALENRKSEISKQLETAEEPTILLFPGLADDYHCRIDGIYDALQKDDVRSEATDILRSLIDRITVTPVADGLEVALHGDLAGILTFASGKTKPAAVGGGHSEVLLSRPDFAGSVGCGGRI